MLSDNAIDKLIQPLINRQESVNIYIIKLIAKRIKETGQLLPSDIYKLERLLKSGADVKKINAELAKLTSLQVRDIKNLIRTVAQDIYLDAKPYFDYKQLAYIPFEQNKDLQRVIAAIAKQTADEYINISKAQAFMIRDLTNPKKLIPTTPAKTYQTILDEAIQASQSGIDYKTAMRRSLQQLSESGLRRVVYQAESGRIHTQRMDTAVRRNLLDGIRAINQGVQDEVGREYGADGKEITVHANSAPDHEPIQGHQFSNAEFEKLQNAKSFVDVTGQKFNPIERAIGTLNCRHFTYSIIVGFTKPNYTKQQLQEFIRKNHEGYTIPNGKHLTMYQCTQLQRNMETEIRYAKEAQIAANAAGDTELENNCRSRVDRYMKKYKKFSDSCGLKARFDKTSVPGYKFI